MDASHAGPDASDPATDASEETGGKGDASVRACKAGYYTGEFTGEYWPGIGEIFPGSGSLIKVDIDGRPDGLSFVLVKQGASALYRLERGCFVGTAAAFGLDKHPFIALVEGTLDCETGVLTAEMTGYYDLFASGDLSRFFFEGPFTGVYEADTDSLAGEFKVSEQSSTSQNPPGGSGTWSASYQGAQAPAQPSACEALRNAPPTPSP